MIRMLSCKTCNKNLHVVMIIKNCHKITQNMCWCRIILDKVFTNVVTLIKLSVVKYQT